MQLLPTLMTLGPQSQTLDPKPAISGMVSVLGGKEEQFYLGLHLNHVAFRTPGWVAALREPPGAFRTPVVSYIRGREPKGLQA